MAGRAILVRRSGRSGHGGWPDSDRPARRTSSALGAARPARHAPRRRPRRRGPRRPGRPRPRSATGRGRGGAVRHRRGRPAGAGFRRRCAGGRPGAGAAPRGRRGRPRPRGSCGPRRHPAGPAPGRRRRRWGPGLGEFEGDLAGPGGGGQVGLGGDGPQTRGQRRPGHVAGHAAGGAAVRSCTTGGPMVRQPPPAVARRPPGRSTAAPGDSCSTRSTAAADDGGADTTRRSRRAPPAAHGDGQRVERGVRQAPDRPHPHGHRPVPRRDASASRAVASSRLSSASRPSAPTGSPATSVSAGRTVSRTTLRRTRGSALARIVDPGQALRREEVPQVAAPHPQHRPDEPAPRPRGATRPWRRARRCRSRGQCAAAPSRPGRRRCGRRARTAAPRPRQHGRARRIGVACGRLEAVAGNHHLDVDPAERQPEVPGVAVEHVLFGGVVAQPVAHVHEVQVEVGPAPRRPGRPVRSSRTRRTPRRPRPHPRAGPRGRRGRQRGVRRAAGRAAAARTAVITSGGPDARQPGGRVGHLVAFVGRWSGAAKARLRAATPPRSMTPRTNVLALAVLAPLHLHARHRQQLRGHVVVRAWRAGRAPRRGRGSARRSRPRTSPCSRVPRAGSSGPAPRRPPRPASGEDRVEQRLDGPALADLRDHLRQAGRQVAQHRRGRCRASAR